MGLSIQDHTSGSIAYWHSCCHAEMIRFQGWWTYLHTLTYTHTKSTWRHTQHVCLFLLNVIKCCSDTAWCWLWWNKSALPFVFAWLTVVHSEAASQDATKVYASSLSAAAVINKQVFKNHLSRCLPHSRRTTRANEKENDIFLIVFFFLFGQLHFSSFFLMMCRVIWLLYSSSAELCRSWVMEKSWEQRVRK